MNKSQKLPLIIIMGPTGVGKSDFALSLAAQLNGEIVNCDVGQFYTPLSIGTAKPAYKNSPITHHLFDILSEPTNFTVTEYRKRVIQLIDEIHARGRIPLVVGGSGFYVNALFYPPDYAYPGLQARQASTGRPQQEDIADFTNKSNDLNWETLNALDSIRAQQIHPHDQYRIERALQIIATGILPSQLKPVFNPVSDNFFLVHVEREREELYARINARVHEMLGNGWIEEVGKIPSWYPFLQKKRLIGYPEIIDYLAASFDSAQDERCGAKNVLVATIQQTTRHYAKRQMTFWRMLAKKLQDERLGHRIMQANLTLSPVDLYIRQLQEKL